MRRLTFLYTHRGSAGTGASSTCDGRVQGGDWCNAGQGNCEAGCGGRWCTNSGGGGGGGGSKCGCNSCTDSVLGRNADGYSVGSRIDWVKANTGRSENDACSLGKIVILFFTNTFPLIVIEVAARDLTLTLHHDAISFTSVCGNEFPGICSECNPGQCSGSPSPPSPSPPSPPTGGGRGSATTTRYWDCSGGACGCSYVPTGLPDNQPAHCHSNAMFAAPRGNPYGAKFYGAAAVSKHLGGMGWLGPSCGKCWKVTGMSISGASSTLVLKGTNVCPDGNPLCERGPHFDIAAPGFGKYWKISTQSRQSQRPITQNCVSCWSVAEDVLSSSLSNDCDRLEPDNIAGKLNVLLEFIALSAQLTHTPLLMVISLCIW